MSWFGHVLNWPYKLLMRATVVPNTDEDQRGFANKLFAGMVPILEKSKNLKQTNLVAYKILKCTVNTLLVLLLAGAIWLLLTFFSWLI